jgi:hypothetical protein
MLIVNLAKLPLCVSVLAHLYLTQGSKAGVECGWNAEAERDEVGYTIRSCGLCFKKEKMVFGTVCFMICKMNTLCISPTSCVYVHIVWQAASV